MGTVATIFQFARLSIIRRRARAEDGFEFNDYRDRIFRLAMSLTLDRHLAEDLAQDCLIKIWQIRHRLAEIENQEAWVARIVINRARSYRKVRRAWEQLSELEPAPGVDQVEILALRGAVSRLTPDLREIVLLVGIQKLSYSEVAGILEIPEGTVASRYHQAKQTLKILLEGE